MQSFLIELKDEQLVVKGLRATTRFYETLSSHHQVYKNVDAYVTGIDSAFLNVAYLGNIEVKAIGEIYDKVSDFFGKYLIPWTFIVTPLSQPTDLPAYLQRENLGVLEWVPCMYCDLTSVNLEASHPDLRIEELKNNDDLQDWIKPISEGFGSTDEGEAFRQLNVKISAQDVFKHFVAYAKGEVVSAGTLFMVEDMVMIHNVATKNAALKKGYGTTLTLYLMNAAKALGYKHCFLESSESGYQIYRKCGFRVYGVNQYFARLG